MNKIILAIAIIAGLGCMKETRTVTVEGKAGVNGTNGRDGATGATGATGERGADGTNALQAGLSCNVHNLSNWNGITNILSALSGSAPVGKFTLANLNVGDTPSANGFPSMPVNLQSQVGTEGYALDCNGYLDIETSGMYTFSMLSDDGVRLVIDNKVIINSPQLQAPTISSSASVELQRGKRAFNVIYYQGPATQIALQLKYAGPFVSLQVIPTTKFSN